MVIFDDNLTVKSIGPSLLSFKSQSLLKISIVMDLNFFSSCCFFIEVIETVTNFLTFSNQNQKFSKIEELTVERPYSPCLDGSFGLWERDWQSVPGSVAPSATKIR